MKTQIFATAVREICRLACMAQIADLTQARTETKSEEAHRRDVPRSRDHPPLGDHARGGPDGCRSRSRFAPSMERPPAWPRPAAWLGLVPLQKSTGGKQRLGEDVEDGTTGLSAGCSISARCRLCAAVRHGNAHRRIVARAMLARSRACWSRCPRQQDGTKHLGHAARERTEVIRSQNHSGVTAMPPATDSVARVVRKAGTVRAN